eukprot:scaffold258518_cov21-Tisochrysis_lutea.AAC.1
MAVSQDDQLAAGLQAVAACCRSFLGPHPATKCVLSHPSAVAADSKSVLVDHPAALLHAMESEPTATTLLLEALEAQMGGPSTLERHLIPHMSKQSFFVWLIPFAACVRASTQQGRREGIS